MPTANVTNVSQGRVNENVVRFTGVFVFVLTAITMATQAWWVTAYLAVDFFFRASTSVKPPLALLGNYISQQLKQEPKWIFAPPKKFAAGVGVGFSVAVTVLLLTGYTATATAVAGILLLCAGLEGFFGICVGCYVYDWFVAPLINKRSK
ncbi:MAG TPA: DUF4395 domain-containing protein [Chitinophagales bacterium]|nr:DUF4395 domain-containing protein [Chitinophagales bacterium]